MQLLSSFASKCVSKACGSAIINMVGGYRPTDLVYDEEYTPQGARYRERSQTDVDTISQLLGNQKQLGATLLGLGLLLTVMGMMLFFEGNLLRLGNIGIVSGTFLLIGPSRVSAFFLKESRLQATIITSIGIFLVMFGRPKLGLLIEIFGLLNLFGNMFPLLLALGRNLPVIGDIITAFEGKPPSTSMGRSGRFGSGFDRPPKGGRYEPDF